MPRSINRKNNVVLNYPRFCLLVTVLLNALLSYSQYNSDSLWTVWNDTSNSDTSRALAMSEIAWNGYLFTQPDSAFYYAQLAFDLAKKHKHFKLMGNATNMQAISYALRGNGQEALNIFKKNLKMYRSFQDQAGIVKTLNNIGNIHKQQAEYKLALEYYQKSSEMSLSMNDLPVQASTAGNIAQINLSLGDLSNAIKAYTKSLRIHEKLGNKSGVGHALNGIGVVHRNMGNSQEAREYFSRSLKLMTEIDNKLGIANAYNNIGNTYEIENKLQKALEYHHKSLTIAGEISNNLATGNSLSNIGILHSKLNNYEEALVYHQKSLAYRKEGDNKSGIANSLNNIGVINFKLGKYHDGLKYSKEAFTIAQEIESDIELEYISNNLYNCYKALGQHQSALKMLELYTSLKDSISSQKNQTETIRQEYQYNYEKKHSIDSVAFAKEQSIKDLELSVLKVRQLSMAVGISVLLAFLTFVFFRLKKSRQDNTTIQQQNSKISSTLSELKSTQSKLIQSEKMASLGQLTAGISHELNNPLNFVQTGSYVLQNHIEEFVELYNDPDQHPRMIELSDEMKQIILDVQNGITRATDIIIGLRKFTQQDTEAKAHSDIHQVLNEAIDSANFTKENNIEIVKNFHQDGFVIQCYPKLLFQAFRNVLSNSAYAIEKDGKITITTSKGENHALIDIEDNGPGMDNEALSKVYEPFFTTKQVGSGVGLGMSITYGIIEKHGGDIQVKSSVGEGTSVSIKLPLSDDDTDESTIN